MEDVQIVGLFWARSEEALRAVDETYGGLCRSVPQPCAQHPERPAGRGGVRERHLPRSLAGDTAGAARPAADLSVPGGAQHCPERLLQKRAARRSAAGWRATCLTAM